MSISIGMVGIGMFGRHFIQLFKEHPDVHRIALCDLRADRLAECSKQFEIEETYPGLDEICKTDIDALVRRAISDQKPRFVEKRRLKAFSESLFIVRQNTFINLPVP